MNRSFDAPVGRRPTAWRRTRWVLVPMLCAVLLAACGRTVLRAEGSESHVERWSVGIEF